jgi:hypothetical protein
MKQPEPRWRKSSYSSSEGQCVEIALAPAQARVRDTKARQSGHIEVGTSAWSAFLAEIAR